MSDKPDVRVIPVNPSLSRKRVGIYARVSTSHADQIRSLCAQVSMMTQQVYYRFNWVLRDIYMEIGSAKTGSSRDEFTRLKDDCKNGEIDIVVAKSLSRFGRDSVEVIDGIRTILGTGATLYFMQEDMHVDTLLQEWEITIRTAINQAENEQRSENIKAGHRMRAKEGLSELYRKPCFGYYKDANGNLQIDEEKASIVRYIFLLYLSGNSFSKIIDMLAEKNIPSPHGSKRWNKKAVEGILKNIKYTGNVEILKNDPNTESYIMWDSHPKIISEEEFDKVQMEIAKRSKRKKYDAHKSIAVMKDLYEEPVTKNT